VHYVERLWREFAPAFAPRYSGVPVLDIRAANDIHGARARALEHKIVIDASRCRRSWVQHETMHILNPAEQHGPRWCRGMIELWHREFGVDHNRALALAPQYGIIAPACR
jgi:hypothetical protein